METAVGATDLTSAEMFKSYYVVWKLFLNWVYFIFFFVFKSYYVVWKPVNTGTTVNRQFGLNRTM